MNISNSSLVPNQPITYKYNQFILTVMKFILTHIIFIFGPSHYLQGRELRWGLNVPLSYANLYLGGWERELLGCDDISNLLKHVISWHRYIDDIFPLLVWNRLPFTSMWTSAMGHLSCRRRQILVYGE